MLPLGIQQTCSKYQIIYIHSRIDKFPIKIKFLIVDKGSEIVRNIYPKFKIPYKSDFKSTICFEINWNSR